MSSNKNNAGVKNGSPIRPGANNTEQPKNETDTVTAALNNASIEDKNETEKKAEDAPEDQAPVEETEKEKKKRMMKEKLDAKLKDVGPSANKYDPSTLFDSSNAHQTATKGTANLPSMKPTNKGITVKGRNVGSDQNEPDWTPQQMEMIRNMCQTVLPVNPVQDTRRSIMDPYGKFVVKDEDGSIIPTEEAYVSAMDPSQYCVGTGGEKFDTTGSPRYYSDAVMAGINGDWLLSQWTSEWIVVEGVGLDVLARQHRTGSANQSDRRIGVSFARIGLPKFAFGALFNTLETKYPGILSQVVQTEGYYWMNASWGVSSFQATYMYINEDTGQVVRTTSLVDVMRILKGSSALVLGTVAISTTRHVKQDNRNPGNEGQETFSLSVKLHTAFQLNEVKYHGPPQQGSLGMSIPERLMKKAVPMRNPGSSAIGGSGGLFATAPNNKMFGAAAGPPPAVKSSNSSVFM